MRQMIADFLYPGPLVKSPVELLVEELTARAINMSDEDNNLLMRAAINLEILRQENKSTMDWLREIGYHIRLSLWIPFA